VGITYGMLALGLPFALRYWQLGLPSMSAAVLLASVGALWNLRWIHEPKGLRRASVRNGALLFGLLLLSNIYSGGFYDPNFGWLYVFPLLAAILGDIRACWVWVGIVSLATAVFWSLPESGLPLPNLIPTDAHAVQSLLNRLSTVLGIGVMVTGLVATQRRAHARTKRANRELAAKKTHLELLQEATEVAHHSRSTEEALQRASACVAEALGWPEARYLDPRELVAGPDTHLRALAHRVLATMRPSCIRSAAVDNASDVAIPIIVDDEIDKVLLFRGLDGATFTDEVAGTLAEIAMQIGLVISRERTLAKVRQLAFFDVLTGLPNRVRIHAAVDQAVASSRVADRKAAFLLLDLDRFKHVNDTFGHSGGDAILRSVAESLLSCTRPRDFVANVTERADPLPQTALGRLGGDEFFVVIPDISEARTAERVAERILRKLRDPVLYEGRELTCTASIGIALFPQDGGDPETLFRNADTAMYHAKACGGDTYRYFDEFMNVAGERRLRVENGLRRAAERGELEVYYQPILDAATDKLCAAEALLRWNASELGPVAPDEFIPIAEEIGLISDLGAWVLESVCQQLAAWREQELEPIRISVNLSPVQLRTEGLVAAVKDALVRSEIDPEWIELEITESAIVEDSAVVDRALRELHALGVSLCLDDFGTGCSALSNIRKVRLSRIKIDKSFTNELPTSASDTNLVGAIIAMAHRLGVRALAEGVEREEQMAALRELHCDEVQGFLTGRPVDPRRFARLLTEEKSL
jgi:diguanylate cyclase (GGDEF)-like protein